MCKKFFYKNFLLLIQLFFVDDMDIFCCQLILYLLKHIQTFALLFDDNLCDSAQYFMSFHTAFQNTFAFFIHCQPADRSITHPEKLIKIIGKYSQKTNSVQQSHLAVGSFLQNTFIEIQPAYLSVYIMITSHICIFHRKISLKLLFPNLPTIIGF